MNNVLCKSQILIPGWGLELNYDTDLTQYKQFQDLKSVLTGTVLISVVLMVYVFLL